MTRIVIALVVAATVAAALLAVSSQPAHAARDCWAFHYQTRTDYWSARRIIVNDTSYRTARGKATSTT